MADQGKTQNMASKVHPRPKPPQRPPGAPVRIPTPQGRLDSIRNPQPRPRPAAEIPKECTNPECPESDVINEDSKLLCNTCGTVLQDFNMVTEVSYGIASGGQHVVHGHHVGADQAYARNADAMGRSRVMDSRELTASLGHGYIVRIGTSLGIPANLRDTGDRIFRLAIGGFIQGRRIKSVAAVALYIAARVQKEPNTYMLIDFSDCLQLNVFNLGTVYKALLDYLALNGNGFLVQPINPEDLILRFAQRLEFGNEHMKVARDAVRIVQRMNRDWMTPGRRPAGICGAALIIAARMNNFRRTVREMVYVVKVTETTIFNRLDEFKVTESSGLTVDEFRTIDLERYTDPPAYYEQQIGKKKRGRKRKNIEFGDDGDGIEPSSAETRSSSVARSPSNQQPKTAANDQLQAQINRRSMPPPPLLIDPGLIEAPERHSFGSSSPSAQPLENGEESTESQGAEHLAGKLIPKPQQRGKRGRPRKDNLTPPATRSTNEPALEPDITAALTDPLDLDHANALHSALESSSIGSPLSSSQPQTSSKATKTRPPIPDSEDISESEFASDPEVADCLLTPSQVEIKTRIWTHENRDYIRAQTAKRLRQELAEANGTARVIVRRKRRRKRIGDMTAYGVEEGVDKPVAGSPAEAVMRMMGFRGFSKKLNYGAMKNLYEHSSGSGSRMGSESVLAGSPGSGVDVNDGGAVDVSTSSRITKPTAEEATIEAVESPAGGVADGDEQRTLDSVVGELEEEGIYDDANDSDLDEGENDDGDDGDHYEGGYDSD